MTITDYNLPVPMVEIRRLMGISSPYFSAMKKAMGLTGARMGTVNQFIKFHKANPYFKYNDVFHRTSCKCEPCLVRRARRAQAAAGDVSAVSAAAN